MAKHTYESIMSELRGGTYRPVYYLMGEEGYFTDKITDYIVKNALDEVERDFNLTVFYGLDAEIDNVITAAKRFPMTSSPPQQATTTRETTLTSQVSSSTTKLQREATT